LRSSSLHSSLASFLRRLFLHFSFAATITLRFTETRVFPRESFVCAPSTTYFPPRSFHQHSSSPHTTSPSRQHPARAPVHTQPTPNPKHINIITQFDNQHPPETTIANPSRALNNQEGCRLFKLAAETRNQIYELVFTIETNEDGHVELNEASIPSNALARTCQLIHNESNAMFRAATYDYPARDFTINLPDRRQRPTIPALSIHFFHDLNSFRITWRADEYNKGKPMHLTSYFERVYEEHGAVRGMHFWKMDIEIHDKSWEPPPRQNIGSVKHSCSLLGKEFMDWLCPPGPSNWDDQSPSDMFATAVSHSVYFGPFMEGCIWGGYEFALLSA
jgi:hypothetical protein